MVYISITSYVKCEATPVLFWLARWTGRATEWMTKNTLSHLNFCHWAEVLRFNLIISLRFQFIKCIKCYDWKSKRFLNRRADKFRCELPVYINMNLFCFFPLRNIKAEDFHLWNATINLSLCFHYSGVTKVATNNTDFVATENWCSFETSYLLHSILKFIVMNKTLPIVLSQVKIIHPIYLVFPNLFHSFRRFNYKKKSRKNSPRF